jgi:hypothetical protein
MKFKLSAVAALIFGAVNFSTSAATTASVSQTFNFLYSFSGVTTSSSSQSVSFPHLESYVPTVLPFDTTLGTLDSVNVNWDWGVSFSGVTGGSGGSVSMNIPGTTIVGGFYSSGFNVASGGDAAAPNTLFSAVAPQVFVHESFTAAGAGVTYNPAIWTAISGNSSYAAKLAYGASQTYTGLASGTFTANADLVVTYNYTAAAIPEPSSTCALLGLCALGLVTRRRMA